MINLTITGYSIALFSTRYLIVELGILFDAGDGLVASLNQKMGRIKYAFISHANRDHLSAINPLNDKMQIFYPRYAGSFPALEEFSKKIGPDKPRKDWLPVVDGESIYQRNDLKVDAVRK
ncbi:MAG: hypothetical protein HOI49_02350 [Bacteroidetes bacterium]|nr:hypothetical protein [Bacteroidota bacterium]